jgi:transposase
MKLKMQDLKVQKVGLYPVVKYYIEQLKMFEVFDSYMPKVKGSSILSECLCVLIQNIVVSVKPLYQIQEWLTSYADGQGEFGYSSSEFTDDRLGSALDALYSSDRQSIMTGISSNAIAEHNLKTDVIHNDTTTVTLRGKYENQPEEGVQLKRGYNKDGCPDCKQIVFGLNTIADGHVPISLKLYDGNISDDQTHEVNWNELRNFLQTTDFCYVADSKMATKENMEHISSNKGEFISILPGSRKEVKGFKNALILGSESLELCPLAAYPNQRKKGKVTTYQYFEGKPTEDGFRLIWIHSDVKEGIEKKQRKTRIEKIALNLEEIGGKLNRYKLKTKEQIQAAIAKAIKGYEPFFETTINEHKTLITKKIGRGKPTKDSKYKIIEESTYSLTYTIKTDVIKEYERQDGLFPLVTNTDWEAKKVLETYKEQPYLEKRFCTLKSVLNVAPIFLTTPKRIEAMLLLYFFALMIVSLIERQIRQSMEKEEIESLAILPQKMKTKRPTLNNLRYLFRDTIMVVIPSNHNNEKLFIQKGFDKIHRQVLKLLKVPESTYQFNDLNWWKFNTA